MTRGRTALALLALVTGIAVLIAVAREGNESMLDAVLGISIGWSFVASGLVAWSRCVSRAACRWPDNSIGPVMVLAGFMRLGAEFCTGSDEPVLFAVGHLLHDGFWIAVAYVLLVFPSGRLDSALGRWVLLGALLVVPLDLAWLVLGGDGDPIGGVALAESSQAARAVQRVQTALILLLVPLVILILARRWAHATPLMRTALAPVLWSGAAGFVFLLLTLVGEAVGNPLGEVSMALLDLTLVGVALGILVGLLRARLARSAVAELVVELGETTAPGDLRDALARALRDPSLALAYWLPDAGRYVDVDGRPFELPAADDSRAVSVAERDGRRIAALVHDPALVHEPELVQSVCAAAALALENARLQAELRAKLEDLRESRARLVEAGDVERRRIERNLHDGAQQRLVAIAMTLGLAETKFPRDPVAADAIFREARQELLVALQELRELSHGIHPAILSERGLFAAIDELALRTTVPVELALTGDDHLPEHVEAAAYYVVAETLANVAKYAHAASARVRVQPVDGKIVIEVADDGIGGADTGRGSGLRGLTDRVEALGGRLWLSSPPGQGTIVRAEIPCA